MRSPQPPSDTLRRTALWIWCGLLFVFLLAPIIAVIPLSFNAGSFLTYPLAGFSFRWYIGFFTSKQWMPALFNSFFVATMTTAIALPLGISASIGLVRLQFIGK